jgi:hypothetical protein
VLTDEQAREAERIAVNMERWAEHPWAAIEDGLVWTLDAVDLHSPIKKFPSHPWLRELTELWVREPLLLVPKSRRMMISWLMAWNHLWLGMFRVGSHIYFQSETELKSNELIQRCEFMFNHLPEDQIIKPKLRGGRAHWCSMEWPGISSFIHGVAEGPNQLRQFTATAVYCDEFAFWPKAQASVGGFKPTVEGGGRVTIVSSAQKGPFGDLCYDATA